MQPETTTGSGSAASGGSGGPELMPREIAEPLQAGTFVFVNEHDSPRPVAINRGAWASTSELSRRIARVAVVFVDAIHGNEDPERMQLFTADLFNDELEAWKALEDLVGQYKVASGG